MWSKQSLNKTRTLMTAKVVMWGREKDREMEKEKSIYAEKEYRVVLILKII